LKNYLKVGGRASKLDRWGERTRFANITKMVFVCEIVYCM